MAVLEKCVAQLNEAKPIRALDLTTEEKADIAQLCFITAKRAMYVGNVADDGFTNNPLLDRLTEFAAKRNAPVVAICAAIESRSSTWTTPTARPS